VAQELAPYSPVYYLKIMTSKATVK